MPSKELTAAMRPIQKSWFKTEAQLKALLLKLAELIEKEYADPCPEPVAVKKKRKKQTVE